MTPEEFKKQMHEIVMLGGDPEQAHIEADNLMCELLTSLGYGEGIAVYSAAEKWYA